MLLEIEEQNNEPNGPGAHMVMPWYCHGIAMAMQWHCHGIATAMSRLCHGNAMAMPRQSANAMAMS